MEIKRDFLAVVARECGPRTLLQIGQGIQGISYDPIWRAALRSATPAVFVDKWQRFEKFSHTKNRLDIKHNGDKSLLFSRYSVGGGTPTEAENLFICGLVIGLLEAIGCRGLWCDMPLKTGNRFRVRSDTRFYLPPKPDTLVTDTWSIGWGAVLSAQDLKPDDGLAPDIKTPPACTAESRQVLRATVQLLEIDISRRWHIGELARELGLSARTCQRRLAQAGFTFSRLTRLIRVHEACRLLKIGDTSLTATGFCAGFADSAHFSRDFRASVGLTPSDYRDFSRQRPDPVI